MSRLLLLLTLVLINLNLLNGRPIKVLFIGNGILSDNGIPWDFKDLAESAGQEVIIDAYMRDSYALSFHNGLLGDMNAIDKIKSDSWDYVVLQEQSLLPVIPVMTQTFTIPAIRDLSKIIREINKCSRIILFMTWARPQGGQYCIQIDSLGFPCSTYFMDFSHMQDSVESSYLRIADSVQAEIAPVGVAWKNAFIQDPYMQLFWGNTNLSNDVGAYLSACVLYSTIFQKSSEGLNYVSNLSDEQAYSMQKISNNTVMKDREKWRIELRENQPQPSFDYIITHNQVQFLDHSTNGNKWFWEFGDGTTTNQEEPVHIYPEFGMFEVCLSHRSTGECPNIICQYLEVEEMAILYPNPFYDKLNFKIQQELTGDLLIEIFTLNGHQILKKEIKDPSVTTHVFETYNISSGTYLIKISASGISYAIKMVRI
jgi:hypothetical protein